MPGSARPGRFPCRRCLVPTVARRSRGRSRIWPTVSRGRRPPGPPRFRPPAHPASVRRPVLSAAGDRQELGSGPCRIHRGGARRVRCSVGGHADPDAGTGERPHRAWMSRCSSGSPGRSITESEPCDAPMERGTMIDVRSEHAVGDQLAADVFAPSEKTRTAHRPWSWTAVSAAEVGRDPCHAAPCRRAPRVLRAAPSDGAGSLDDTLFCPIAKAGRQGQFAPASLMSLERGIGQRRVPPWP